jgi:nicotinate-nucleotide adenylyltransferase
MKIGLLFGSYNPVHIGHLLLATRILEYAKLDSVWLVVSPHNPHKNTDVLADENHRLNMVKLAVLDHPFLKVCDIEFSLLRPSYTYQTLKELTNLFGDHIFSIIIGEDNLEKLDIWKEVNWIKDNFEILVYNRYTDHQINNLPLSIIHLPLIDISATEIRKRIEEQKTIRYFVPEAVDQYIRQKKLYK